MSLKGRSCWVVNIRMDDREKLSLEAIGRFVEASEEIQFEAQDRLQLYGWVERVLVEHEYARQGKPARGLLRRYLAKMTGLSRAQTTRLIARYTACGRVRVTAYRRRRFAPLYARAGIELLASVDEAHETLSGPATRRILEREVELYGKQEYARLHPTDEDLSVGTPGWLRSRWHISITCARASATASGFRTMSRRGPRRCRSASGKSLSPKASLDICAWTQCIREIGRRAGERAFITSTPPMRSRSGRWRAQRRASRRRIWSRF